MPTSLTQRLLAALLLVPAFGSAQTTFQFWDRKSWLQNGPTSSFYLGGWTDLFFQDGSVALSGCAFHPSFVIFGPDPDFCPLGTNGFTSRGDVDRDGIDDSGAFWSFASVIPATVIEPYRRDRFRMIAAPPSGIADGLRANNGSIAEIFSIEDKSLTVWFSVLVPPPSGRDITVYEGHRHYGSGSSELTRHYWDVPWGTYIFSLPALDDEAEPPTEIPFAVNHLVAPDAFPGRGGAPQGWRMTNTPWVNGRLQFDPRTFIVFEWLGLNAQNTFQSDTMLFSMRGNQYVAAPDPTAPFPPAPTSLPTMSESVADLSVEASVSGVSCVKFADPVPPPAGFFTVAAVMGTQVTADVDLDVEPGGVYQMEITGPPASPLLGTTYRISSFGDPTAADLTTPEDLTALGLAGGDTFTLAGLTVSLITTDLDLTEDLKAGSVYEMRITSGGLKDESLHVRATTGPAIQYPISVFGPQPPPPPPVGRDPSIVLTPFEFLTATDISGGEVTGTVVAVAGGGTTITTNRDLLCLTSPTYRLTVTSGPLVGTTRFPISVANLGRLPAPATPGRVITIPGTLAPLPTLAPDATFDLSPEEEVIEATVEIVAGNFIKGLGQDYSTLILGTDYRIEITTGPLAGAVEPLLDFGYPGVEWFETQNDLSATLAAGHKYKLRAIIPPSVRLLDGDSFQITQRFPDWVQEKYDAGQILAVDEFTLTGPPLFGGFGMLTDPDLIVDVGLLGPLYAVARENVIVFPPFPIQTPPGDRSEVLIGALDSEFELGPFFFRPGDSATGRLTFGRQSALPDTSERVDRFFNWRVQFIDTYDGFTLLGNLTGVGGFPFGTPLSERRPEFDLDRDGASNVLEWALRTAVADPGDRPTFKYNLDRTTLMCTASLTKRPFTGGSVSYFFEYSTDLVNWMTILPGDPIFDLVQDNATTLEVRNRVLVPDNVPPEPSLPPANCFLRVKVVLN